MMASAATLEGGSSPTNDEIIILPVAQPRGGVSTGTSPILVHDSTRRTSVGTSVSPASRGTTLHPPELPGGARRTRRNLDEEKKIALSQLQELEAAIKVRKVTKVDGRKNRWVEYRARKQAEEAKQGNLNMRYVMIKQCPVANKRNKRGKRRYTGSKKRGHKKNEGVVEGFTVYV
ncbi:putative Chromodomain Y-like 1 [Homarus americanus]|uniref:Putative Chromodomain Y-like 1 n=1 Tax=Homarus americanus TaxID=6706 RepID=A0A8J5NBJ6_HOMAM|nr:putative Chromodomain Y-like 1 [Homarus americanus]